MFFSSALVSTFLLTSAVLADLPRESYRARLFNHFEGSGIDASNKVKYSTNWAGAIWEEDNVRCRSQTLSCLILYCLSGNIQFR